VLLADAETLTGVVITRPQHLCALSALIMRVAPGALSTIEERWDGKDGDGVPLIGAYRVVGQPFLTAGPQSAPVTVERLR
jgi:hypothetical protein